MMNHQTKSDRFSALRKLFSKREGRTAPGPEFPITDTLNHDEACATRQELLDLLNGLEGSQKVKVIFTPYAGYSASLLKAVFGAPGIREQKDKIDFCAEEQDRDYVNLARRYMYESQSANA